MTTLRSEILELPDSQEAVLAAFCERNWCDGLPVIAPTPERVEAMLEAVRGDPSESLGAMPPLWGEVTLEKLAINAVMAGCLPQYLPVIVAAVEAMLDPVFNLNAVQTTTHPVAPLLVVSGPYATQIGMHGERRLLRSWLQGQCDYRSSPATDPVECRRSMAGTPRHGDARKPGKVLLCDCGE